MEFPTFDFEASAFSRGATVAIGTDEVGAGPLAGPVVAGAVALRPESVAGEQSGEKWFARVRDSKKVSAAERELLAGLIKANALAWAVAEVSEKSVDALNIRRASLLAMRTAVREAKAKLGDKEKYTVFVDGKFEVGDLGGGVSETAIISGDAKVLSIAAASLIAKVHRDSLMVGYAKLFPLYGFEKHKGYGTPAHIAAIKLHGPCAVHRKTFLKNFV